MKKKLLIFSIVLIAISAGFFLKFIFFKKSSYSCVPLKFLGINKLPYMEVKIEGKPFDMLVDLGSPVQLNLGKESLENLSKKSIGTYSWIDINGNKYDAPKYRIDKVKLNKIIFGRITVSELPLEYLSNGCTTDGPDGKLARERPVFQSGTIGLGLIKACNALFDFKKGEYYIVRDFDTLKKKGYDLNKMTEIPFKLLDEGILVSVQINQIQKHFIIDTGCSHTLIKKESLCDLVQNRPSHLETKASTFQLSIGSFKTAERELLVYTPDNLMFDGLIGMDILRDRILAIDFENEKLYLSL